MIENVSSTMVGEWLLGTIGAIALLNSAMAVRTWRLLNQRLPLPQAKTGGTPAPPLRVRAWRSPSTIATVKPFTSIGRFVNCLITR
uniref:Uncharacterized protein n=1 Tax=Desertifilum tharense IPPAS B-1220 TaxID=1781255 RepID=A0ACD5GMZ3_9CYAN